LRDKVISVQEAVEKIEDGMTLYIGGFLSIGTPDTLIDELIRQEKKQLTVIANDSGHFGRGISKLVRAKLLKKIITSHIGTNPETGRQMMAGDLEVVLIPQGTLVERIRSAGAGRGGFFTPPGIDTSGNILYEGTTRNFNPIMATAAPLVIAEASRLVPMGDLDPNHVVTPGLFVDYIVREEAV
jgi:acetate CoA/acetoacetate CoA-transferase alpha subunit